MRGEDKDVEEEGSKITKARNKENDNVAERERKPNIQKKNMGEEESKIIFEAERGTMK